MRIYRAAWLCGLAFLPLWLPAVPPSNQNVSTPNRVSHSAAGDSFSPLFSSDGSSLIFLSRANNLIEDDNTAPFLDIFARNISSGETFLVSRNTANSGGGNGNSAFPVPSTNGDRIVFVSAASNLVNNDTNDAVDVFVRDRAAGVTRLVSIGNADSGSARDPLAPAFRMGPLASQPGISANGRWVVFASRATNLHALPDPNSASDVFARDLDLEQTLLVSVNASGDAAGFGLSDCPSISSDGQKVAFLSTAQDLTAGTDGILSEVYVRDLTANTTRWASQDIGPRRPAKCLNPVMSVDGRSVIFAARDLASASVWLYRFDLPTGQTLVIATNATEEFPAVNADGTAVAYEGTIGISPTTTNLVFLWRAETGLSELISLDPSGAVVGPAQFPGISPDGQLVTFIGENAPAPGSTTGHHQVYARNVTNQTTRLVSVATSGLASSQDVDPAGAAIHPDKSTIAFASRADDLAADDLNQASDIFLRHLDTAQTSLVTERAVNRPALTGAAISVLGRHSVSLDGRFVLLRTAARDLAMSPAPTQGVYRTADVVIRDRLLQTNVHIAPFNPVFNAVLSGNGRTVVYETPFQNFLASPQLYRRAVGGGPSQLVSSRYGDNLPGNGVSRNAVVSPDGNLVAYDSSATDLVANQAGNQQRVYLRDLRHPTNMLVSISRAGPYNGNAPSSTPVMSLNARWVVFQSLASDLTDYSISSSSQQLYARDLSQAKTFLLSAAANGQPLTGNSTGAVISADSKQVAYVNSANNIYVCNLAPPANRLVCTNCYSPALSADGSLLVYEAPGGNGVRQILLQNIANSSPPELISINHAGTAEGNDRSRSPIVSRDGRFVVFISAASDLVASDTNERVDVFLRDRVSRITWLLTPGREEFPAGRDLFARLVPAPNGQTVFFQSFASNVGAGDFNDTGDIFALELGGGDSDGDGLDDAWEIAYFDNLSRDGQGDFDMDGASDRAEFLAGTNPVDNLPVVWIAAFLRSPGGLGFFWVAIPNRYYRVQYKTSLTGDVWYFLPGSVRSTNPNGYHFDSSAFAGEQRYYRLILEP